MLESTARAFALFERDGTDARQWFRAEDALLVIRALEEDISLLDEEVVRSHPWWRSSREGVLRDLKAYRLILERAAREGQRFRSVLG